MSTAITSRTASSCAARALAWKDASSSAVGAVFPDVQSARTSISLKPARTARSIRALAMTESGMRLADSDAPTATVRGAACEGAATASASSTAGKASLRMGGILQVASAAACDGLTPRRGYFLRTKVTPEQCVRLAARASAAALRNAGRLGFGFWLA